MMHSCNPTLAFLLLATRQQLTPTQQAQLIVLATTPGFDWQYLVAVSESHGIAPLVFNHLQHIGPARLRLPPAIGATLQAATYRNVAVKAGVQAKLVELCAFCRQQAVEVMLLKGTALDQLVYDKPWYTVHDVDLLLRPRDHDAMPSSIRTQAIDRYFWDLPGFEYETATHHDLTINGLLPINIAELWHEARPLTLGDQQAWVMAPEDLLLAAAVNACRKRFLQLKALLAVAALIEHYPTLDWSALAAKAQRRQCAAIFYSACRITQLALDVTLPHGWAQLLPLSPLRRHAIDALAKRLLRRRYPFPLTAGGGVQQGVSYALLLPYLAYRPHQIYRKGRQWLGGDRAVACNRGPLG